MQYIIKKNRRNNMCNISNQHLLSPRTVFGIIVAALKMRKSNGILPFAVLSCDNIQSNGKVASNAVVGLAGMIDPALGVWIAENVAFPNSMVDR